MVGWRWRVAASTVPVTGVMLGLALLVPVSQGPQVGPVGPGASTGQCLDLADISSLRSLDRWVRTARGDAAFAGGDVGASAQLSDGRSLFLFGDTIRRPSFDGVPFVRNSMLVIDPECAQVVLPADGGAIVPERTDGVGYWPMSVVVVPRTGYDLVGVSMQRVRDREDPAAGVFAFDILGPSAAFFVVPLGGTPQLVQRLDLGPDRIDPATPMWGAAVTRSDGWVYLYGTARPAGATTGGFTLRVARVRPERFLDLDQWEYYDASTGDAGRAAAWQDDPGAATELIPAEGGVSQTLSVFEQDGVWFALSKQDEVLGDDLAIWTAPAPEGPFTLASTPAAIPSDAASGTLRYLPLAHPELLPRPGTVVVSYSENNTDAQVVLDDPRLYRPRFLRVPLPAPAGGGLAP